MGSDDDVESSEVVGLPTECSYFLLAHLVTLNVTAISWSWSCLLSFKLKACLADAKVILIKILLIAPFFFFFFFVSFKLSMNQIKCRFGIKINGLEAVLKFVFLKTR